jgi:hypothetical protein
MARERYFLYVDGTQRGPYTVSQIHHMVNNSIVSSEAMFWCEGLEQWQPVTQLIVPKEEKIRRRFRLSGRFAVVLSVLLILGWIGAPMIRQGWKEQHQVEFTPEAAYWRARGIVREGLGKLTAVQFDAFQPGDVQMSAKAAVVRLGAQTRRLGGSTYQNRWVVSLHYDARLKQWEPDPIKESSQKESQKESGSDSGQASGPRESDKPAVPE